MNNENFNVLPLFSSPVAIANIGNNLSELNKIKTEYEFIRNNLIESKGTYITKNIKVLDNFPHVKNILIDYFNFYKNSFLRLEDTKFKITTSWGTKTDPGGSSQFHKHRNCVYSGVLYFEDVSSGKLELYFDNIMEQMLLNKPTEWNIYNSKSWSMLPEKNTVVFFPSYLSHKVTINESSEPRYSLAFNMFPEGFIGEGDSSMNIEIK